MYFEVNNTPEHVRRSRSKKVQKESPKEECPLLLLAPFSRPPQVIFDDALVGSPCERVFEVLNPSKQSQEITLGKALPAGFVIHLPGEWLEVEAETCYTVAMTWTPKQPTSMRETIWFTNKNRGRYDVNVVLKTVNIKGKNGPKGFKTSPGKMKKKVVSKKSPVSVYKKKAEKIYNKTTYKHSVNITETTHTYGYQPSNGDISRDDYLYAKSKCPFDTTNSDDVNFRTSEIFPDKIKRKQVLQETYNTSYNIVKDDEYQFDNNILKPSNGQNCSNVLSTTAIFDNLTFTPLKDRTSKVEKLEKGPRIIVSVNSDSDFDNSLQLQTSNKENETHSIISVTSTQPPNKWLTLNHSQLEKQPMETPKLQNKKQPNTSSPKEFNSPNFSINTEFSRISDLSFFPQKVSTEKKCYTFETHDILEDKVGSDTYTKDSPNPPMEHDIYQINKQRPPQFVNREYPKMCHKSLFRDAPYQQQHEVERYYSNVWQNDLKAEVKSPPRSITPPLQSIPEESAQFSESQVFNKTGKDMATTYTFDRTYDKPHHNSMSLNNIQTWSKKAVRVEPTDLWKVPNEVVKKSNKSITVSKSKASISGKVSNATFDNNQSIDQYVMNQFGDVYSQSSTVDPFLSTTYFYDAEAVGKIEIEFKKWLNCILTPPADLDSNIEHKIDVGKAWLENRNKDVPLAPTKEQVCSIYHNSHRLQSLRRSARTLLMSPEMVQVFQKLNVQIDKKLIAVRIDKNLHMDVGLQKMIMELILSYNPLWLRIGLEAIYGFVIPLKSNSDIEGLTTFIIQRLFRNPYLKNKHSKSSAPNMLLPAYMEAIKKFTLKTFFKLVYFLDQAKQKKLISHDPCLFCRNAVCKESREIIIRFTRELIASIGDITKHLRRLGYVVSHKQTILDEYKFAVHNLALDIRDGVRLTKVMEIILIKEGLMNQLRTPAISRLQKVHNVQVALTALEEANFVIVGDITATDIADGHREKTLSLLWQIIHVFRAPLFEKAANVIQTWWKKKFEVIKEKRREEEKNRLRLTNAVSTIQQWWWQIKYKRQIELRKETVTRSTIVIQKYCRMWLLRTRFQKYRCSVLKIEEWFKSAKLAREAKSMLQKLRDDRLTLMNKCATTIQCYVRRWLSMKYYKRTIQNIVKVQSFVRSYIIRKHYLKLRQSVIYIQQKYKSKILMRLEMRRFAEQKRSALIVQSYYRMIKQRRIYLNLKTSVQTIEERYIALVKMRNERRNYLNLQKSVVALQALYRAKKCRQEYLRMRKSVIFLQRKIRAHQLMKIDRANFLKIKSSVLVLQTHLRSHIEMKKIRGSYLTQQKCAIIIQRYFRGYCDTKRQKHQYVTLRNATVIIQRHYRNLLLMRKERSAFLVLKEVTIHIQRQYRAQHEMKKCRDSYQKLKNAALIIQRRYRAMMMSREQKTQYQKLRASCIKIQNLYRANVARKRQRQAYMKQKAAALKLQRWYRSYKKGRELKRQYEKSKQSCVIIQTYFRAFIIARQCRLEFLRIKTATICIQRFYRSYIEFRTIRREYIKIKTSTLIVQKLYRSYREAKKQREAYLKLKSAVSCIENAYTRHKELVTTRQAYIELRRVTINVQKRYRNLILMRNERNAYLKLKLSVIAVQQKYRAMILMRVERQQYLALRSAAVTIQTRYRAQKQMKQKRLEYNSIQKACVCIQRYYRAYVVGKKQRDEYLVMRRSAVIIQSKYKASLAMRKARAEYLTKKAAAITVQRRLRANILMTRDRREYLKTLHACKTIQSAFRAFVAAKKQRTEYTKIKTSAIVIQTRFRALIETRRVRKQYLQLRNTTIMIQNRFRVNKLIVSERRNISAMKIQKWYRLSLEQIKKRREASAVTIQKNVRGFLIRSWYRRYLQKVIYVQKMWRGKLMTKMIRSEYLHKRSIIIRIQSLARGFLVRREVQIKKTYILKAKQEQREYWAAAKIQALFRGNKVRMRTRSGQLATLRARWRRGALQSAQDTLARRNTEALLVLHNCTNIDTIIKAFKCLEVITEIYPMLYHENAAAIVERMFMFMFATNRSIPSIELLLAASAVLVNFARYKVTGPKIYNREDIEAVLKFMLRFSNSETHLFCILSTYIWLFFKYDTVREDLAACLQTPENHKVLLGIKSNVEKMSRMANNASKQCRQHTLSMAPTRRSSISHVNRSLVMSGHTSRVMMPALDPNYGIVSFKRPKYFEDAKQAINCIFETYNL